MPTYEYHAIRTEPTDDDSQIGEKSFMGGVVVAHDRKDAKAKLRDRGLKATMLRRARGLVGLLRWFEADIR